MDAQAETKTYYIDPLDLPSAFPTHRHPTEFWAALGRAVGTFGFLEEVLGKAIFSFTGTRRYPADQVDAAYERWQIVLEKALSDQLASLIAAYDTAVKAHDAATVPSIDKLVSDLREAAVMRNVLCHGSWRPADDQGRSVPLFVNKKKEVFETAIDVDFLEQVQRHVAELSCDVINSVTQQGWQFPGSSGPGMPLRPSD